jgi:Abnormal spindle-like microcephaly-assoc'd, ASPM-SPD-2-Hydin
MRWVAVAVVVLSAACGSAPPGAGKRGSASAVGTARQALGAGGDDLRSGWYPDQPLLAPSRVSAPDFGQLFDTAITGQVHAQPLLVNGRLLVVTESNDVYSLDPETGAVLAHRTLHVPWNPADVNCVPLAPSVGIMGTPVVDEASGTAYFTAKTYVSGSSGAAAYWAHAVDVATLQERSGFPVQIQGSADNVSGVPFDARQHLQRPGLILLDGVVYATFAGNCDIQPWKGWIFGVSTAGQITARWAAVDGSALGAGIWQTGGAPVVDGPGTFLVSTGNGAVPTSPLPGSTPPVYLGEAWVRLTVQGNGTLKATDFFIPYDASQLNQWDGDLGSGAPMGLPDAFGTAAFPHLAVATGKQGYVYLLDRDHLGGFRQGASGGDDVLQRVGPYGGVWGKPSAWPGSGGWVYVPTVSAGSTAGGTSGTFDVYRASVDGSGNPTLARVAQAAGAFGLGTSAPVVTSDGTTPGSALVWITWMANNTGTGAELRAYDAVPVSGTLPLRFRASIGQATRYAPPGVGDGRIYVATQDGHVRAFGAPVDPVITAPPLDFGPLAIGQTSTLPVTFTAQRAVQVTAIDAQGEFAAVSTQPPLPVSLTAGQTVTVQVSFTPSTTGIRAAALVASTDQGQFSTSLSGIGQSSTGQIQAAPAIISFGGIAVGRDVSSAVTLTNVGGAPATLFSVTAPGLPFSATGLPAPSTVLQPQGSVTVTLQFAPTAAGDYQDALTVDTDQGSVEVNLTGTAASAGELQLSTTLLDFGQVQVGQTAKKSFTVHNGGGSRLRVNKSQPPGLSIGFTAGVQLPEGTTLDPDQDLVLEVDFTPASPGAAQDRWVITADDDQGPQQVVVKGTGVTGSGNGGTGSGTSGCTATGAAMGWWMSLLLAPWLLRRRRAGS